MESKESIGHKAEAAEMPIADIFIEASWEVCNKVGGIYTVVKSKAARINENYRSYFLVGPFFSDKAKVEAQQQIPPDEIKKAISDLEKEGIGCFYGKWLIKGEPNVILLDYNSIKPKTNELKSWLWENFGIDSLNSSWDFNEPVIWAYCVARLIERIAFYSKNKKIVSQFHEWLAGFALLYLKKMFPRDNVSSVFTTHATMLGRAIAGTGYKLYSMLESINAYDFAKKLGVIDKFTTEKACASEADAFTTVSEITSIEAEKLLGKKADVLLLNGLDIEKFPSFEEDSVKHQLYRDIIREFIGYYFFPYYTFDLEHSLNFFIVGRYEFKNKGIDIFINALGRLNERLKEEKSDKTVVAFFWIPHEVKGIKQELLESAELYRNITELIERNEKMIKSRIINSIIMNKNDALTESLNADFVIELKKLAAKFKKVGMPGLCTHNISDEDNNLIIKAFKSAGLLNREDDKVKVVLYPVYLNGSDGLLNLKYYDALSGCHLGVFPSYYEPWGYTPLESAALGVPSVTTDLAGFGRFIKQKQEFSKGGIFVLNRFNEEDSKAIGQLSEIMRSYVKKNQKERVEQKLIAKKLSEYADWKRLIANYIKAHNISIEKKQKHR